MHQCKVESSRIIPEIILLLTNEQCIHYLLKTYPIINKVVFFFKSSEKLFSPITLLYVIFFQQLLRNILMNRKVTFNPNLVN